MINAALRIKQGDTFKIIATLNDTDGNPLIGIADKLKSQVRSSLNVLYADLDITETDEAGKYLLQSETDDWVVGTLYMDIQYTDGDDNVTSSPTIQIEVEKDVTKPCVESA